MAQEIERKFLVKGEFSSKALYSISIIQGYLCSGSEATVRVRVSGSKAYLTIKGKANETRVSRYEWEKEIPPEEAYELIRLCRGNIIEKTRFIVPEGGKNFEVDVFHGDNEGLIIAEIELEYEDEDFARPEWLGIEVTQEVRYSNSMLSQRPYKTWQDNH